MVVNFLIKEDEYDNKIGCYSKEDIIVASKEEGTKQHSQAFPTLRM